MVITVSSSSLEMAQRHQTLHRESGPVVKHPPLRKQRRGQNLRRLIIAPRFQARANLNKPIVRRLNGMPGRSLSFNILHYGVADRQAHLRNTFAFLEDCIVTTAQFQKIINRNYL